MSRVLLPGALLLVAGGLFLLFQLRSVHSATPSERPRQRVEADQNIGRSGKQWSSMATSSALNTQEQSDAKKGTAERVYTDPAKTVMAVSLDRKHVSPAAEQLAVMNTLVATGTSDHDTSGPLQFFDSLVHDYADLDFELTGCFAGGCGFRVRAKTNPSVSAAKLEQEIHQRERPSGIGGILHVAPSVSLDTVETYVVLLPMPRNNKGESR